MENGVESIGKPSLGEMNGTKEENLQLNFGDESIHGDFHERKDSEVDEVFEEAMEAEPEDNHVQKEVESDRLKEHDSQKAYVDWSGEVEQNQKVRGNENSHENDKFEETIDTKEDYSPKAVVDGNGEEHNQVLEENGSPYGNEQFEESMDLVDEDRGHEDGMKGVEEKVGLLEVLELVHGVAVESGAVNEEKVGDHLETVSEFNGTESNGASGIVEGVGEVVSEVVADKKMETFLDDEKGRGRRQADIHPVEAVSQLNVVESNGINGVVEGDGEVVSDVVVDTKMKASVDGDEVMDERRADIHKPEYGDFVKLNSDGIHEKLEDGYSDKVSFGTGLSAGNEGNRAILDQDKCQKIDDSVVDLDAMKSEEIEALPGESQTTADVVTTVNEKIHPEADESETREWQDSQAQLSNDDQEVASNHSEVIDGNDELGRSEEPEKQVERDRLGFASEMHQNEFVSVEEYDVSTSTEEDDSELSIQSAPIAVSSDGRSMDPPPPSRPAGLGSFAPPLEPAPRVPPQPRVNGTVPQQQSQLVEDPLNSEAEEYDETREKLQMIRVKFLRLAHRLGQTPHNVVVAQVLYRLGLAEQLRGSRNMSRAGAFSFDRASAMAEQLEAAEQDALDFSCTIMVLGKTGVGKSATINSIFDEVKFNTNAFQLGTQKVEEVVGMVQGIKVRVIDTPGLLSSCADQRHNEKILQSVKRFIKKTPPDIVLYLDRLDMQSRDYGDVPLLRTITDIFGPSIWFNAIVVLTHAASAPPDGPNGTPLSYEMFVTQRSHVVQQAIRQAAGDLRVMNPVSLVENHSACRTNRAGQRVLPNGQVWKPHLLLLSFASKILAEANTLLKLQDGPPGKPFGVRSRVPPLPFLLSSLLQSRPRVKLPEEQFGDEDAMDEDLDDTSDSDEESEYDELPPFKCLTKSQVANLSKAQRKAYYDELEYREKLFMKKQLKEERKRRKLLKKMAAAAKEFASEYSENIEQETGGSAAVPIMPDLPLPTSFDSDNPIHRYRCLESSNQWLVRPILETHGWDHDVGYEGLTVERLFVVKDKIPVSFSGQLTKDKKESSLQMELASSVKHGEGKATSLGFDMQTVGKDMAYTLRSETKFANFRHNKTAAGLSVTALGDALSAGVKLEDELMLNKRFRLVMSGGAMAGRGEVAYGGSLEATLRDKDYPIGRMLSTLGVSVMDWHGDLAIGCNVQALFPVGRTTNMTARANLNNRGAGQVSIRLNSSEQLQIAFVALIPVLRNIIKSRLLGSSQPMQ